METQKIETHKVDVRGLFGPEALLIVESTANRVPGDLVEILSDNPCFTTDLLRWCGDGYGLIISASYDRDGDRFLIAVPTREEGSHQGSRAHAAAA